MDGWTCGPRQVLYANDLRADRCVGLMANIARMGLTNAAVRRGGGRRESRARAVRIADGEMGRLGFIQTGARGARTERRRESASD